MTLTLTPLTNIPLIQPGHNLEKILLVSLKANGIILKNGDILSITQKIVSKVEGRFKYLRDIKPSDRAVELAKVSKRDPRYIELILQESKGIIRVTKSTIIVEHRLGFICASAGIDRSNVSPISTEQEKPYLLLPKNPEKSAKRIQKYFKEETGKDIGIIIIDSHGRPWRYGVVGIAIGIAGVPALVDMRGKVDLFNRKLKITKIGAADELAAASSLIMGQADERIPAVHIRGFPYKLRRSSIKELFREKQKDLFR